MRRMIWMAGVLGVLARAAVGAESNEEAVTVITSDRLTFDAKGRTAVFEHNVLVTDPKMQMAADRLIVKFDEQGQAQVIRAEGRVTITQLDRTAQAEVASYDVPSGKIVLTGKPRITRGRDVLEGEVITYWRHQDRMICQPGARMVIYSEQGGLQDRLGGR